MEVTPTNNKTKAVTAAVIAIIITLLYLNTAVGGLQAHYSLSYLAGSMIIPISLWIITLYYYMKHKKDKKANE